MPERVRTDPRLREIRTGIFVIVALLLLVACLLWIAGRRPLAGGQAVHQVLMKDAGGVRAGDQVRIAGVQVGRVEAVDLRPGEEWPVAFRVTLEATAPITGASTAHFASDGFLGSRFLEIEIGDPTAEPLAPGAPILGSESPGMTEAMAQMGDLVPRVTRLLDATTALVEGLPDRLDPLLARLDAVLSEENTEHLSAVLAALRATLEAAGPRLPELLDRLEGLLDEVETGVEGLPALTSEAEGLVVDLRAALGPDGERLATLLDNANVALGAMEDNMDALGGSTGELEAALRDLRAASANLRALSQDLKERPSRILRPAQKKDRSPGEGGTP